MLLPELIRARAIDFFLANGADPTTKLQEVILLKNVHYSGRCFSCQQLQAIWIPESGELALVIEQVEQDRISISDEQTTANAA